MKIAVEEAFVTRSVVDAWAKLIDDGVPGEPGLDRFVGRLIGTKSGSGALITERLLDLGDLRLTAMTDSGVDCQLIGLTSPGVQVFDADTGSALATEANDILIDAANAHPGKFAGLAAIAPQAPRTASKEMERAKALGLKGVIINSHTKGEYLDASPYWPILEAAEALDMPLYLHPRPTPPAMSPPFSERHLDAAMWGFQTETALHALRLMVTGIFDRFPKLKVALGHLGEGLPFWIDRIDRVFTKNRGGFDIYPRWTCQRLPGDYFLENFWVTSSGHNWGPALRCTEQAVGADRLLFAVDYPYEDSKQQVDQAAENEYLDAAKFYELNARQLFDLGDAVGGSIA